MRNYIYIITIILSSLSFIGYSLAYFIAPKLRTEFKELKIDKLSKLVVFLELLGAFGLLIGFFFTPILIVSSLGLSVLMLLGVLIRLRHKQHFKLTLQALFFMLLNGFIFFETINLN